MRIVIAGSSGLIGRPLVTRLRHDGHDVTRLVRHGSHADEAPWDPDAGTLDMALVDGADAVINLAGAGIGDHRWTDAYRATLRTSRLRTTDLLARTIAAVERRPSVFLCASAIGYYGPHGDETLDESAAPGTDFLAKLCVDWEAATAPAEGGGTRVAHLRTGIVLSAEGGALRKQLPLFKLGLGGRFGSGRQWQSWISITDEIDAIVHLLSEPMSGPVNLTAPGPVTNAEFARTLAAVLKRPSFLSVPSFGPKLLLGGELSEALLFTGQRVVPAALERSGFHFGHSTLEVALRAVLGRGR